MPDSPRIPAFAWDPSLYGRFGAPRLRPALELLAHVRHPSPDRIHDLGTGRGEMARAMALRWPEADVTGSDLSVEMLEEAATTPSRVEWVQHDVRTWKPSAPLDVIYSNAVLHWIDGHDVLFPRLLSFLAPGGVMAVQMPLSWDEPSHRLMRECLASGGTDRAPLGDGALRASYARRPVDTADWYYDLLAPLAASVDIWETRYLQVLEGDNPVVDWVSGTALRPVFDGLDEADSAVFLTQYASAIRRAYPPRPDGTTLFSFPRLFIVATR